MINKRVQCNSILMAGKADCGSSFGRFMQSVIGNMKTTIKPRLVILDYSIDHKKRKKTIWNKQYKEG